MKKKKNEMPELPKVEVKNHAQLLEALKPFKADSTLRKLFMEGMEVVKRQSEFKSEDFATNEEFGGFLPAEPASGQRYSWVDTFIKQRLDAKRDGLKVVWSLPEGEFEFDPWTKDLRQTSAGESETNS
jgi:hypothetical protein